MKRWAALARFGGVGDNLIAASVLHPLKKMGYMCEVITSPPNHVVYHHNPNVDKLAVKVTDRDLPKDANDWQKWFDSRQREYDIFMHGSHSCESRHSLFRSMTEFWAPAEYRRKRCAGSYIETVHDIAGVPYIFGPLYYSSPEEIKNALTVKSAIGERCIAWIVSGSRIDKVYPYSTMAVARIIKEIGAPVVLVGGPSDKELSMSHAIRDHVALANGNRDGLHIAVPAGGEAKSWPLRTALTFVQQCDLIITPDTGPAWAVAFEQMPKIVMLSHGSQENVTKHWVNTTTLHADQNNVPCWPCHRLHDDIDTCVPNKENNGAACISDISVERLLEAVSESWRKTIDGKVVHADFGRRGAA